MSKKANDELRARYTELLTSLLDGAGEEVLRVGTNEIAIPVVDGEGNDAYVVFVVKVPSGSRDGEPYDGHGAAASFVIDQKQKAEQKAAAAEKKAKKIARDQAYRAKQAENKAKREGD